MKRSERQNNALHKYLRMVVAEASQKAITFKDMVEAIRDEETWVTEDNLKEVYKLCMRKLYPSKRSTTELSTAEMCDVTELFQMFLARNWDIQIRFPSEENMSNDQRVF